MASYFTIAPLESACIIYFVFFAHTEVGNFSGKPQQVVISQVKKVAATQTLAPELSEPPNTYVLLMQTINRVLYVRAHYIAMRKRTECRGAEGVHLTRVVTRQQVGDHLKPTVSPIPVNIA